MPAADELIQPSRWHELLEPAGCCWEGTPCSVGYTSLLWATWSHKSRILKYSEKPLHSWSYEQQPAFCFFFPLTSSPLDGSLALPLPSPLVDDCPILVLILLAIIMNDASTLLLLL